MRLPFRIFPVKTAASRAFTLIELLVVISIIAVLAGLLLPVAGRVIENAKKVTAKNALVTVVNAVKNYQAEYGSYPIVPPTSTGSGTSATDTTFKQDGTGTAGSNGKLCFVLRALNSQSSSGTSGGSGSSDSAYTSLNPRRIVYLEYRDAKSSVTPKDGFLVAPSGGGTVNAKDLNGNKITVGDLVDPWGDMYGFRIDTGYSDKVIDPYKKGSVADDDDNGNDDNTVHTAVIGWSMGKDHAMATSATTFDSSGNVASWR